MTTLDPPDATVRAIYSRKMSGGHLTPAEERRLQARLSAEAETLRTGGRVKQFLEPARNKPAQRVPTAVEIGAAEEQYALDLLRGRDQARRNAGLQPLPKSGPATPAPVSRPAPIPRPAKSSSGNVQAALEHGAPMDIVRDSNPTDLDGAIAQTAERAGAIRRSPLTNDATTEQKIADNALGPHVGTKGQPAMWKTPIRVAGRMGGASFDSAPSISSPGGISMVGADGQPKIWKNGQFQKLAPVAPAAMAVNQPGDEPDQAGAADESDSYLDKAGTGKPITPSSRATPSGFNFANAPVIRPDAVTPSVVTPQPKPFDASPAWTGQGGMTQRPSIATPGVLPPPISSAPVLRPNPVQTTPAPASPSGIAGALDGQRGMMPRPSISNPAPLPTPGLSTPVIQPDTLQPTSSVAGGPGIRSMAEDALSSPVSPAVRNAFAPSPPAPSAPSIAAPGPGTFSPAPVMDILNRRAPSIANAITAVGNAINPPEAAWNKPAFSGSDLSSPKEKPAPSQAASPSDQAPEMPSLDAKTSALPKEEDDLTDATKRKQSQVSEHEIYNPFSEAYASSRAGVVGY